MTSSLDKKERGILIFALAVSALLLGVGLHAAAGENLKEARDWIAAIIPISGSIFAFIALLRAGRSLEFTSKQFTISQSIFIEQRVNILLKNIVRLEGLVDRVSKEFVTLSECHFGIHKEMVKTCDWTIEVLDDQIVTVIDKIIKDSDELRLDSQEHHLFTILWGFRAGMETLKSNYREDVDAIKDFLEAGEENFASMGPRVRAAEEAIAKTQKELLGYLKDSINDYRQQIAKNLRELYASYGAPLPESLALAPGQAESYAEKPVI